MSALLPFLFPSTLDLLPREKERNTTLTTSVANLLFNMLNNYQEG